MSLLAVDFDEATHTYRVAGQLVPNVTRILEPLSSAAYGRIPPGVLAAKAAIGKAVHKAADLIDADDLDEESVDPAIAGYVRAYRLFLEQKRPTWILGEQKLAHPVYKFAGTLDRFGLIDGARWVVDLKTTRSPYPHHGVQLAAYLDLLRANELAVAEETQRASLYLHPDGTYRLKASTSPLDFPAFLGLMAVHNWRSHNGLA